MPNAAFLFQQFSKGHDVGPVDDYVFDGLPKGDYESVDLASLPLDNQKGHSLEGSTVWFPAGKLAAVRTIKFMLLSDSPGCTFYFLQIPRSTSFRLNGSGHSVCNLNATGFKMVVRMGGGEKVKLSGCSVIIGERSFCAGAEAILIDTTMLVKKGSLWSNGILVQGTNQHGIVDLESMSLVKYPRNRITLEPHVWIGRRAILCSGAEIGAGSIVGTGALVAKKIPQACIVGGNPARIIKRNRTWADNMHSIAEIERDLIDRYVTSDAEQGAVEKAKSVGRAIWTKALAAGVAGAALFEGFTELLAMAQQ